MRYEKDSLPCNATSHDRAKTKGRLAHGVSWASLDKHIGAVFHPPTFLPTGYCSVLVCTIDPIHLIIIITNRKSITIGHSTIKGLHTNMPTNQISKTAEMCLRATLLVQQPLHLEEHVPQIHPTHSPTKTEPRILPQVPTLPLWQEAGSGVWVPRPPQRQCNIKSKC